MNVSLLCLLSLLYLPFQSALERGQCQLLQTLATRLGILDADSPEETDPTKLNWKDAVIRPTIKDLRSETRSNKEPSAEIKDGTMIVFTGSQLLDDHSIPIYLNGQDKLLILEGGFIYNDPRPRPRPRTFIYNDKQGTIEEIEEEVGDPESMALNFVMDKEDLNCGAEGFLYVSSPRLTFNDWSNRGSSNDNIEYLFYRVIHSTSLNFNLRGIALKQALVQPGIIKFSPQTLPLIKQRRRTMLVEQSQLFVRLLQVLYSFNPKLRFNSPELIAITEAFQRLQYCTDSLVEELTNLWIHQVVEYLQKNYNTAVFRQPLESFNLFLEQEHQLKDVLLLYPEAKLADIRDPIKSITLEGDIYHKLIVLRVSGRQFSSKVSIVSENDVTLSTEYQLLAFIDQHDNILTVFENFKDHVEAGSYLSSGELQILNVKCDRQDCVQFRGSGIAFYAPLSARFARVKSAAIIEQDNDNPLYTS